MERKVAFPTHLKMTRQCRATNSCKFNKKQITPESQSLSVELFRNQACMFFHSIFYEFQMEINVALATPLKMTRQ